MNELAREGPKGTPLPRSSLPSFSIVIPTYQRREVVTAAARAIADIRYSASVELIVVVDGSTDGTEMSLREIDCPFPKRIVIQENAGQAAARNRGAALATGDILLFLDDDMICRPDILDHHARSHHEGADVVLGHVPLDARSLDSFLAKGAGRWAEDRARKLQEGAPLTLFDLTFGHASIKRLAFEAVNGFDPAFTAGGSYGDEDLDLGVRLLEKFRVVFNPDAVASQRYVVVPQDYLRQWKDAGKADVMFSRKHPTLSGELFCLHGSQQLLTKFLIRPISHHSWLTSASNEIALWLADHVTSSANMVERIVAVLFRHARDIAYWSGVRQAGGMPTKSSILVLCYHAIANLSGDNVLCQYGIGPEEFASQLDKLAARGFSFVSPDELVALLEGTGHVPQKAVLLTFDDCYEELLEVARTILAPRRIKAVAFAVTGMQSGTNEWDQAIGARKLRLLHSDELLQLPEYGVEVGSHSMSHQPLPCLDDAKLANETFGSAQELARLGLRKPRFFAYPHGVHDSRSRAAVRSAKFIAGFGLRSKKVRPSTDRFALPRVEILARDVGKRFWLKTSSPRLGVLMDPRAAASVIARRLKTRLRQQLHHTPGN